MSPEDETAILSAPIDVDAITQPQAPKLCGVYSATGTCPCFRPAVAAEEFEGYFRRHDPQVLRNDARAKLYQLNIGVAAALTSRQKRAQHELAQIQAVEILAQLARITDAQAALESASTAGSSSSPRG